MKFFFSEKLFDKKLNESNESNDSLELTSIESISPKVMANELTLIAKQLLLSIKSREIIILLIRPHSISPVSFVSQLYYIISNKCEYSRRVRTL